jgi:hypothetical protein
MRKMKAVVVPQPFATLASVGMISMFPCERGVHPGPIAIQAGPWTDRNLQVAKSLEVILRGIGVRSRRLMPVDHILAAAEIYDVEHMQNADKFKQDNFDYRYFGLDDEQLWRNGEYCLKISSVSPLSEPQPFTSRFSTTLLTKAQEANIRLFACQPVEPWYS